MATIKSSNINSIDVSKCGNLIHQLRMLALEMKERNDQAYALHLAMWDRMKNPKANGPENTTAFSLNNILGNLLEDTASEENMLKMVNEMAGILGIAS